VPHTSAAKRREDAPRESNLPTLQERKQEVVRSAIWDAAIDLFVEKGYDETTVDDIAEKAGVSRRSFFRYFSSKSDLVAAGMATYGEFLTEAIDGCAASFSGSKVFRLTISQVARTCVAQPRARKMMQILSKYPAAHAAQYTRTLELLEAVEAAFARRKRSFGDLEPRILAGLTVAVLQVVFQTWFEKGDEDISVVVDQVLATLGRVI
jgi:AcrR family transcriptional regulator